MIGDQEFETFTAYVQYIDGQYIDRLQGFLAKRKKNRFLDIFIPQNPDEQTASEGHANEAFSGSQASLAGRKNSLYSAKPETELVESQTTFHVEPETETEDREESERPREPNDTAKDDTRECSTPQQTEDQSSLFSSQLFEHEDEVPSVEPATSDGETPTATVLTAGSSTSQDAEPSTSAGKGFWDKARQLASQRRRSRMEHNRVLSNNGGKIAICVSGDTSN